MRIKKALFWRRLLKNREIDLMDGNRLVYILALGKGRGISLYQVTGLSYELVKKYF